VDLHVDDDGFVRAPVDLVYRRLTHVLGWPTWWPAVHVEARPPDSGDEVVALELHPARARRVRLTARLHGWRHDQGFALALRGPIEGHAEFWLEPGWGGVVVHHLLIARATVPDPLRLHADYRRVLRRGLWGLKDVLELEVRTSVGAPP
jgi:hypothetical protein